MEPQQNTDLLAGFPAEYRNHPRAVELRRLLHETIYHDAESSYELRVKHNLLRHELVLLFCGYTVLARTLSPALYCLSRFAVPAHPALLQYLLQTINDALLEGCQPGRFASEYHELCSKMVDERIDLQPVRKFQQLVSGGSTAPPHKAAEQAGFCAEAVRFICFAERSAEVLTNSLAIFVCSDLIIEEDDNSSRYELAVSVLEQIGPVDDIISTMIEFGQVAKALLDACLRPEPLF